MTVFFTRRPPPVTGYNSTASAADNTPQEVFTASEKLDELLARTRRVETRLVRLMDRHGLDPDGNPVATQRPNSGDRN